MVLKSQPELFEELPIDREYLIKRYLFGLRLKDSEGNEFPDELFETQIKSSLAYIETELDLGLTPRQVFEEHDYDIQTWKNYIFLQPDVTPIQSVEEIRVNVGLDTAAFVLPLEWVKVSSDKHHVQVVPLTGGPLATVFLGQGQVLLPLLQSTLGFVPSILEIDYTAGFKICEVPEDILHLVSLHSSIGVLNIAGDLIIGAGIASKEISVPGLRQKIQTTASPTNSGFGARILQYRQEIKDKTPIIRNRYQGLRIYAA